MNASVKRLLDDDPLRFQRADADVEARRGAVAGCLVVTVAMSGAIVPRATGR